MLTIQAIVEGDPPDLPESFSDAAKDFVRSCLHKVPKLRPTYAMLLQHPWLKPLSKPPTITEEAEDDEAIAEAVGKIHLGQGQEDEEVAAWVKSVLARLEADPTQNGSSKPALHNAPLDSASPLASPAAGTM